MGKCKVTVLMSVYNGEKYLREAVESILNQTYNDFEFLIINDASTDKSMEILQSYDDPRIRIVSNEKNLGLTKSLNKGISLAKGEFIARMDADDISLPERLKKQIDFFEAHPDAALVGTFYKEIDYKGNDYKENLVNILPLNIQYPDLLKHNLIIHGSVMVRREIVEKLSGYNELLRKCQDYALWLQMAKEHSLYNIPEVLYKLRIHDGSVSKKENESIFYHILALKIAECTISENLIEKVCSSGVECLQNYFNNADWIYYHRSMAMFYRSKGDLIRARKEYWNLLCREPKDMQNIVNLLRVYCGNNFIKMTNHLYFQIYKLTYKK